MKTTTKPLNCYMYSVQQFCLHTMYVAEHTQELDFIA